MFTNGNLITLKEGSYSYSIKMIPKKARITMKKLYINYKVGLNMPVTESGSESMNYERLLNKFWVGGSNQYGYF